MVLLGLLDDFVFGFLDFLLMLLVTIFFLLDIVDLFVLGNRIFYLRLRGLSFFDLLDFV